MPEITASPGIRCPSSSDVSPVERRLLSEDGVGPRLARTIELDERQRQTLSWNALTSDQTAEWKRWYRDDLFVGGAWFSAPPTWPTPEGLVVKVRRFVGAPAFSYLGNGHWRIDAVCEVRGETLLPQTPAGGDVLVLWADYFEGASIDLEDHAQDVPYAESTWIPDLVEPQSLQLTGFGGVSPDVGNEQYTGANRTLLGEGLNLWDQWYVRVIADVSTSYASGTHRSTVQVEGISGYVVIRIDYVTRICRVALTDSVSDTGFIEFSIDDPEIVIGGKVNVSVVQTYTGATVRVTDSDTIIGYIVSDNWSTVLTAIRIWMQDARDDGFWIESVEIVGQLFVE